MLRDYEFTMIVRPDLSEEDLAAVLAHYEQKIADREGTVLRKDAVGTKRFSYPIKKCFRGYYVNYDISANPKVVKDMEHQIRFDDKVLRHLIIGMDRRRSAAVREEVADEQKRIAEAQAEAARLSEEDNVNATPATLDDDDDLPLSEETVIDSAPPLGKVIDTPVEESNISEDSVSAEEETVVEGELPNSKTPPVVEQPVDENKGSDDKDALSEETVIDTPSPQEELER